MTNLSSLPFKLRSHIWLFTVEPRWTVEVRFKYDLIPDPRDFFDVIWETSATLVYATSPLMVALSLGISE